MIKVRGLQRWRLVVLFGLGLFCMSLTLLLVASTSPRRIEAWQLTWLGGLDVLTAFAVAIIGILIYAKARNRVGNSERQISYHLATALPVTMLLAMWYLPIGSGGGTSCCPDSPGEPMWCCRPYRPRSRCGSPRIATPRMSDSDRRSRRSER